MAGQRLTEQDVTRLLAHPSPEMRAETAAKIAAGYDIGRLTANELRLAEEIFRIMVRDAELRVRMALSNNLKENPAVPHDVARALAEDVESVAIPMLEFSAVLTDGDLIEIIRRHSEPKQLAITRRKTVSEQVSEELVDTRNEKVVSSLVSNSGAAISEVSLQQVVDAFGDRETMQSAIIGRPGLPITVAERLVTMVSEKLQEELAKRHPLNPDLATDLVLRSRERAVIALSTESDGEDVEKLVRQMREHGRLTSSILLRGLCMGDLRFFETAVSELAGVPLVNGRQLIHDSGSLGLRALFTRAGMPEKYFPAVRAAIDVASELQYDGEADDRARYSRRMIERILTQYGDLGVDFDSDDLEYLLGKMERLPSNVGRNGA